MKVVSVLRVLVGTLLLFSAAGCTENNATAAPLWTNYAAAQQALANDNFEQAKTALTALAAESTGDLQKQIQTAAAAADIDGMRMAFRSASDTLIQNGVPAEYAVAFCPMYKGGASWVQKKGPIVNPYTGESMPGCGSFKSKS